MGGECVTLSPHHILGEKIPYPLWVNSLLWDGKFSKDLAQRKSIKTSFHYSTVLIQTCSFKWRKKKMNAQQAFSILGRLTLKCPQKLAEREQLLPDPEMPTRRRSRRTLPGQGIWHTCWEGSDLSSHPTVLERGEMKTGHLRKSWCIVDSDERRQCLTYPFRALKINVRIWKWTQKPNEKQQRCH